MKNNVNLIVGLGNPGLEYSQTRHNIGQRILEEMASKSSISWKNKFHGKYASTSIGKNKVHFLIPETYMNLSGKSVLACAQFFKILPLNILILHDELDIDFGCIQLRIGGGLAGHNGLKSIAELLSTQDFMRMRVGISRPKYGNVSDWVLGNFGNEESSDLIQLMEVYCKCLKDICENGIEKSKIKFNKINHLEKK